MNVFDLFHKDKAPDDAAVQYPETAQDGGHPVVPPNAEAKYFDPAYPRLVPVGVLPTTEHPDAHWLEATKQGKFIPFIGEEPHGVDISVHPDALPVADVDLIAARGHGFGHPVGDLHTVPVPVTVVDAPVFFGIEKRISTNQYTLTPGTVTQLCARRPERTTLQVSVTSVGPATIGSDNLIGSGTGFVIPLNGVVTIHSNQQLFVVSTVAAVVSVFEEYTVVEGQKRV